MHMNSVIYQHIFFSSSMSESEENFLNLRRERQFLRQTSFRDSRRDKENVYRHSFESSHVETPKTPRMPLSSLTSVNSSWNYVSVSSTNTTPVNLIVTEQSKTPVNSLTTKRPNSEPKHNNSFVKSMCKFYSEIFNKKDTEANLSVSYKKSQSPFSRRKSPKLSKSLSLTDQQRRKSEDSCSNTRLENKRDRHRGSFEVLRDMDDRCPLLDFEVSQEFDDVFLERQEPSFEEDIMLESYRKQTKSIQFGSAVCQKIKLSSDFTEKDRSEQCRPKNISKIKIRLSSSDFERLSPTGESVKSQDSGFSDSAESPKINECKKSSESNDLENDRVVLNHSVNPKYGSSLTPINGSTTDRSSDTLKYADFKNRSLMAPITLPSITHVGSPEYNLTPISINSGSKYCLTPNQPHIKGKIKIEIFIFRAYLSR